MYLTEKELKQVTGGEDGIWAAVGGVGAFVIGLFDGCLSPTKCG